MGWSERRAERRHRRLLAQMDRAALRSTRARRGTSARRAFVGLGAVVVLTVTGGVVLESAGLDLSEIARPRAYVEIEGRAVAIPRPVASEGRILPAVEAVTTGSYAFLHTTDEALPVGYDPCRPVRYVIRPEGMPAGGEALVADAAAIVSGASGVALVADGFTDEAPALDRALIQPSRYGDGWVPVLIAWSGPAEMPELAGQVAGVGGSAAVPGSDGTGMWLAAGRVVLDADDLTEMLAQPAGDAKARAIVVHELAHVLGLDHVDDDGELMHPITATRTDLGPGDRQGLALVGQVPCEE